MLDYTTLLFYIPQDIKSIEYINEWDTETELYKVTRFDEAYYKKYPYNQDIYTSYENFKKSIFNVYNKYENFEINEDLKRVRYSETFQEKRFSYRIETANGFEIIIICLYKFEDGWKTGAIFKKDV
ncbi:MAG: hypothetical protein PF487_12255 [Bacteroidales bacterium]|nr:hypothetical protein [Bacteroidales bacterium]